MAFRSRRERAEDITGNELTFAAVFGWVGAGVGNAATNIVVEEAVFTRALSIVWGGIR